MLRLHRDQRGQSLVIVLSLITILFLLGSSLAVHASVALRSTRTSAGQGNDFYAADAATELGIWWQRNGKAGNPPAQTINGITTSTTITSAGGGGGSCPTAPTVAWMTGFEHGNWLIQANGANANNLTGGFAYSSGMSNSFGNVDIVPSPARSGNFAMRVAPNSGQWAYAYHDANSVNVGPTTVVHVAIRLGVLPTTDASVLSLAPSASTGLAHNQLNLMYRVGTGKWALGLGTSAAIDVVQESTISAALDTWYSFDIRFPTTASYIRLGEWYIDGIAQTSVTATDSPSFTASNPRLAFGSTGTPVSVRPAYTAYYDDVIISTTPSDFPIGDININGIKPDGFGTNVNPANFQVGPPLVAIGATSWQTVIETPMTAPQNSDFIRQVTVSATSYLELTLADTTQTCIRGADAIMAAHPDGTSANNTKTSVFDGATESILYSGDISIATVAYSYAIKPITPGGAWTPARVNGLKIRFGYGSDINPIVSWDAFIVEVASTTVNAAPATITVVGTGGGSTVSTSYTDAGPGVPSLTTWTTTK
jgi:Tfp pilus assembly protein PilX